MIDVEKELKEIFNDPLFDDIIPTPIQPTSDDRLIQSFEEVNTFFERHGRLPQSDKGSKEKLLWKRLQGFLNDSNKVDQLCPYDRFELLRPQKPVDESDLIACFDDPLLDPEEDTLGLFTLPEHLKKAVQTNESDYIAQRRPCKEFDLYEEGFKQVHEELKSGQRSFVKFTSHQLEQPKSYFVLDGMLVYLAEVIDSGRDRKGRLVGRSICIFENGTMSDIKLDTLRKALYENGTAIRNNSDNTVDYLNNQFNVETTDKTTGYIYVLESLSDRPEIKSIDSLYKIGFCTTTVEERIANAEHEATYLNAKVKLIASWKAYNLNVSTFESLIHRVFNDVRLQVRIGNTIPEEWFIVPYPAIEKAIQCLIKEIPISYDRINQVIVEHTSQQTTENRSIDTTGWKILTLNIKENYFNDIVAGRKREEYRLLKSTTIHKYTYIEEGKRWLRKYDAIHFYVGYHKDRSSALVEVVDASYETDAQTVVYKLGKVIQIDKRL